MAPHIDLTRQLDRRVSMDASTGELIESVEALHISAEGNVTTSANNNTTTSINKPSRTSTHTFILYLTDCESGGETVLLRQVPGRRFALTEQENILAAVRPCAGRLFVFPHACPHSGAEVTCVPKLLLRGEMI